MCGILGFINGKTGNTNADDFIIQSIIASSIRGTDGTGLVSVDMLKKTSAYQKLPVSGSMFLQDKYAMQLARYARNPFILTIGHNRAATSGLISLNETHPFCVSYEGIERELIGVHNGTLNDWKGKPGGKDYTVDSEWGLNHIYDKGIKAFEDFKGAYCFVWWDSDEAQTLNIALNNDRPMNVAFTADAGMGFASEPGMLQWLFERNAIKRDGPILQLTGQHWYRFEATKLKEFSKERLPFPVYEITTTRRRSASQNAYSKTHVELTEEFLIRIGKMQSSKPAPQFIPATKAEEGVPQVTSKEIMTAKELFMNHEYGKFTPIHLDEDTHELIGTYKGKSLGDMDAIIRNVESLGTIQDEYDVVCLGVQDNAKALVAVCRFGLSASIKEALDFRIKPETAVMH